MSYVLEVEDVVKNYPQGTNSEIEVLCGVSFKVAPKETVSVVGASGGGKSTLLSILSGVDRPSKGSVKILGRNLAELSDDELTSFRGREYGIVFQQFHLISHLTALENVMLPLEINGITDAEAKAKEFLHEVGLSERLAHMPSQLSGGETQRVAIARALAIQPKIILADEPSGNLDVHTGQKVMDLLFALIEKHHSTLVLVTHNDELAKRCQRRLSLENGKISEI